MGQGKDRNEPCHCGSGKKQKKCCADKKPRETSLLMDMGEKKVINRLKFDKKGQVTLLTDEVTQIPKTAKLIRSLKKDKNKGIKQIFNVPQDTSDMRLDLSSILLVDFVYFIDTNTTAEKINGKYMSVSVVHIYKIQGEELIGIDSITKNFSHEEKGIGEKIGIIELLKLLDPQTKPWDVIPPKITIITDHDLGNLAKYNSGELPLSIEHNVYLPPNIQLAYASADKRNDSVLNKIISQCDQEATKTLHNRRSKRSSLNNRDKLGHGQI